MVLDAEALVAWLEILELPEMANYILLTSVLKQVQPKPFKLHLDCKHFKAGAD